MEKIKEISDSKKYPSYRFLQKNFGFFIKNLFNDNEIPKSVKIECLKKISSIRATSIKEFEENCNQMYFFKNKLRGKKFNKVEQSNPFVRLNDKDTIITWISTLTGIRPTDIYLKVDEIINSDDYIKPILFRKLLSNKVLPNIYRNEKTCLAFFGVKKWVNKTSPVLGDAHIAFYKSIQWSFPNPQSENLFKNQNTMALTKCRAGLIDRNKKLILLHTLTTKFKVCKPTILDAGFYEQFEPNGYTKPLSTCKGQIGFEEYVHIPNKFSNLTSKIYETF